MRQAEEAARLAASQALEPDAMDADPPSVQQTFAPGSAAFQCATSLVEGLSSEAARKALQAVGVQESVLLHLQALQAELLRVARATPAPVKARTAEIAVNEGRQTGAGGPSVPQAPPCSYGAVVGGSSSGKRDGLYQLKEEGRRLPPP